MLTSMHSKLGWLPYPFFILADLKANALSSYIKRKQRSCQNLRNMSRTGKKP